MPIQPYLFFDGRCEEAIDFYRTNLGAEVVTLLRYKEMPGPHQPGMIPPGGENKVMHASFQIGGSEIMASDGRCGGQPVFNGFSLSINPRDEADAQRMFAALGNGGQVRMPLTKTFFSPCFGMVADKFGVVWMIYIPLRH